MATLMKKTIRILWASWLISAFMVTTSFAAVPSGDSAKPGKSSPAAYRITAINWEQSPEGDLLRIRGGAAPTYTMYELFEPLRVIIDVADASLELSVALPMDLPRGPVSRVNGKVLTDKKPTVARIELILGEDHDYSVDRAGNDIVVRFPAGPSDQPAQTTAAIAAAPPQASAAAEADLSSLVQTSQASRVLDIEVAKDTHETRVYLKADGPIKNYKKVLLGKNPTANRPDRMYLDLNNLRLSRAFETRTVGTAALDKIRTAKREDGFRIVFDSGLDKLFAYSISERPDGLLVTIKEPPAMEISDILPTGMETAMAQESGNLSPSSAGSAAESEPARPSLSSAADLDEPGLDVRETNKVTRAAKPPAQRDLSFAGYTKQRITVDFYKIDLHNVFRLFGEISNLNIVVDEAVGGSLTLALNDVPWDFALDIILNLKDLQKEERFNTIVISPKSKSFTWPERALDNIEFKSDIKIQQAEQDQGGLKISKRMEVPETVIEAKKLIHQANLSERKGDFATAIALYEEAFSKWSDNVNLAKRISALCLINLEQNAKAVHYARTTLKLSPGDSDAALQAAIGLARMKRSAEAKEFFEMSVSGEKPSSEALSSYSSFCEEQLDYDCSLTQLKRHEDLHGDTLDTMVSKARIYDKQGKLDLASLEYRTILLSGYELPPDLARYVKGRAALAGL